MEDDLNAPRDEIDRELVRLCQEGETEAFGRLVQSYKVEIFCRIFRWVGQKELAEEIAQEVFLKAFRDLKNFRGEAKFSTWLFQIALNRCRDFWRSKQRLPPPGPALEEIQLEDLAPGADEEMERRRRVQELRQALSKLKPKYREALSLRYITGLSNSEIAELTQEGLSNVKMRVARGLSQLRKELEAGHRGSEPRRNRS